MKSYYFTHISCDSLSLGDPLWNYIPKAHLDCYHFSPSKGYPVTTAAGVWSDKGLTVMYETNERPADILARYHGKNEPVCTDSCCEFFFNPLPKKDKRYFNFELSAGGGLLIEVGEGRGNREKPAFELADFKIETEILSDGWRAKLFIPFAFIKSVYGDFDSDFAGNFYKCGDDTACRHYAVWSKVDLPHPDYHRPEFFAPMYLNK